MSELQSQTKSQHEALSARLTSESERRELLLVSDAALVMKTTARRALVWAVGARDGKPIEGAEVALWARRAAGSSMDVDRVELCNSAIIVRVSFGG